MDLDSVHCVYKVMFLFVIVCDDKQALIKNGYLYDL